MTNRSATPVLFGFDFQANAAIVLMLENIKYMTSIRLEGYEDIEINLNDGSSVLAQAKAVVNSSTDFSNVISNLKKTIVSLSEAEHKSHSVKELIYITNSPNPFNEKQLNPIFYGVAQRSYDSLPQALKNKISKIISSIDKPLDTSKFKIQILPFETDNENERYKCVMEAISNFIPQLGNISIAKDILHKIWVNDVFRSGTKRSSDIKLSKKDIIWPVIVLITQNWNYDEDDYDDSEFDEISRSYESIINTCTEGLLSRSIFFINCRIELSSHHDYTVVFDTILVSPFFRLEIPFNSQQSSFTDLIKIFKILILAPCLTTNECRNTNGFFTNFFLSAKNQRETCY